MGKDCDHSEGGTAGILNAQRQKRGSVQLNNLPRVTEPVGGRAGIWSQSLESFPFPSQSAEQVGFGSGVSVWRCLVQSVPGLAANNLSVFNNDSESGLSPKPYVWRALRSKCSTHPCRSGRLRIPTEYSNPWF